MTESDVAIGTPDADRAERLLGRMEAVPFGRWHRKPRIIIGTATFFDAFDALSLAFAIPALRALWDLGGLVEAEGIAAVFLMFAGVSVVGIIASTRMIETRNRRLEDIAQ